MLKIVCLLAVVAVARAGILPAQPVLARHVDEYDPHPQYNFAYEVQDALSGDSKSQAEVRDGDNVQGHYSLIDADGYKRIVDYSADAINGFNAVVRREPLAIKAVATAPAIVRSNPLALSASPLTARTYPAHAAYTESAGYAGQLGYSGYSSNVGHAVGYAAPNLIQSASPAAYGSAHAHHLAPSAIVKTTYSSPIASYHY